ncbi:TetR family transcriptional regulator [Salsuginibacillus halophilus]|uniref:TetR family transcriptional regulator n=1 Tax=Salsuginibacillus halophilus TaxID=517424 RepID=A0A2P8HBD6_9BACI|nr:TetR family transcriptional regulator [Salsuginibacillus halophilus]PSL43532.1 TetR family transcriptional regulator [Salsuginibacillus halophilus]
MSQTKKTQIISAAKQLLAEHGIENIKVNDIVKQAGVAQGTFYLYFRSKSALIPEIAAELIGELLQIQREKLSQVVRTSDKIDIIIDTSFEVSRSYRGLLSLCYSGLAINDELSEWERIYEPYKTFIEEILEAGKAEGEVTQQIATSSAAQMMISLIEETTERVHLHEDETEVPHEKEQLRTFLKRALLHV